MLFCTGCWVCFWLPRWWEASSRESCTIRKRKCWKSASANRRNESWITRDSSRTWFGMPLQKKLRTKYWINWWSISDSVWPPIERTSLNRMTADGLHNFKNPTMSSSMTLKNAKKQAKPSMNGWNLRVSIPLWQGQSKSTARWSDSTVWTILPKRNCMRSRIW